MQVNGISLILISLFPKLIRSIITRSFAKHQSPTPPPHFSILILGAADAFYQSHKPLLIYSVSASKNNHYKFKGRCHSRNNKIRINKPLILLSIPLHRVLGGRAPVRKLRFPYGFKSDKFVQRDVYLREHPRKPDTYEKQWDDEEGSCECLVNCEEAGHGELEDE